MFELFLVTSSTVTIIFFYSHNSPTVTANELKMRAQTRMQTPCLRSRNLRRKLLTTHILIHARFMQILDLIEIISAYKSATRKD